MKCFDFFFSFNEEQTKNHERGKKQENSDEEHQFHDHCQTCCAIQLHSPSPYSV